MVYMKQNVKAYKKFTYQQKYASQLKYYFLKNKTWHSGQHNRNFRGTNTYALELDVGAESLIDTTHEQSLSDSRFVWH